MRILSLLVIAGVALVGCKTADDNPVSAQKMQEIRRSEANERENFNPSTAPPSGQRGGR